MTPDEIFDAAEHPGGVDIKDLTLEEFAVFAERLLNYYNPIDDPVRNHLMLQIAKITLWMKRRDEHRENKNQDS